MEIFQTYIPTGLNIESVGQNITTNGDKIGNFIANNWGGILLGIGAVLAFIVVCTHQNQKSQPKTMTPTSISEIL
jgi:hypothetical protein